MMGILTVQAVCKKKKGRVVPNPLKEAVLMSLKQKSLKTEHQ